MRLILTVGMSFAFLLFGCKKKSENAVVEEVPAATATETDPAALTEEPVLQQIESGSQASPKDTFNPKNGSTGSASGISETGRYVVQVAVFKNRGQAKQSVEKLSKLGYTAYIADVENPSPELSGTYYRVRIGRFASLPDAKSFGENMKAQGFDYWVDQKANDHTGGPGGETYSAPSSSTPSVQPSYKDEPVSSTPASTPSKPVEAPTTTPQDDSWGTPTTETPAGSGTPKDTTNGAVEGW